MRRVRWVLKHPFLALSMLPMVVILTLALFQITPSCRAWKAQVNSATHLFMRDNYGIDPKAASVRITEEGHWDDSWSRMRHDVGVVQARELASDRPSGCF